MLSLGVLLVIEFVGVQERYHPEFIYDCFLALFGSSIILFIGSIIEYDLERRRTMESFYQEVLFFRNKFSSLKIYYSDSSQGDNFEELIRVYVEYSKLSTVNLGNLYAQMHFILRHKKKREWIDSNLYNKITSVRAKIIEAKPHFEYYLQANQGNKSAVSSYLTDVQNEFFSSKITSESNGYYYRVVYNKIADDIDAKAEIFRNNIYKKWSTRSLSDVKPQPIFSQMWKKDS